MTRFNDAPNPNADSNGKDKFKNLDDDFKTSVAQETAEQIYKRVSDLAAQIEALENAKKDDMDLAAKKDEYETCAQPYKEQFKDLKLRTKFCVRVLGDRGKV